MVFLFEDARVAVVGVICDLYAYIPIAFALMSIVEVGMGEVGTERQVNISLLFTHSDDYVKWCDMRPWQRIQRSKPVSQFSRHVRDFFKR